MRKPPSKFVRKWLESVASHHPSRKSPLAAFWKVRWEALYRKNGSPSNFSIKRKHVQQSHEVIRAWKERRQCQPATDHSFHYDRLNWASKEIRLIRILPEDPETATDEGYLPVGCEIKSVSLDEKPSYIALSYAWGDTTLARPLVLNGKDFHATASLDAALRQIRKMQVESTTFRDQWFWVDALCINQEDEIEKSWQVQRMNQIFQEAQYALVWLGTESKDSEKAMRALEHIGLSVAAGADPLDNAALSTFHLLSGLYNEFSPSVRGLLMRSWWRRIWVVQEFASAKDVVFLCGDVQLSWRPCFGALEALEKFQRALAEKGWRGNIGGQNHQQLMTETSIITEILRLFRIRHSLKNSQKRLSLWELLTLKRFGMLSSDNRDFVYALTGIAEDAAAKHLYPDYTKHVAGVYTEVAKCFLAEGRLRTLWLCSHPRHLPGLPSWVPDWSSIWQSDRRYFSGDSGYGSGPAIFSASAKSVPDVSFSSQNGCMILHLEGFRFDTVSATKPAFDMQHVLRAGGFLRAHLALQSRFRAFWELQGGWDKVFRTAITDIEPIWGEDLNFKYRRSTHKMRNELYGTLANATDESGGFEAGWRLPASRLDILYRNNGRKPFITSKGFLGLGPEGMRDEDVVVLICGAEVPFVLREEENKGYTLVGEAYVDGIMDGQVMDMGLNKVTFDIV